MLGEKHDLVHEFPEYHDLIQELQQSDPQFARLFDQYEQVEREVYRIEQGIENSSDDYLEERKRLRLHLKDQLFEILRQA